MKWRRAGTDPAGRVVGPVVGRVTAGGDQVSTQGRLGDDIFALVEATRAEPVGHLEGYMTERDEADLALLHATGVPRHARRSPRSTDTFDRLLAAVTILAVSAVVVIVVGEFVDSAAWRWAVDVACWVLVASGVVGVAAVLGWIALTRFEAWYEARRDSGGSP